MACTVVRITRTCAILVAKVDPKPSVLAFESKTNLGRDDIMCHTRWLLLLLFGRIMRMMGRVIGLLVYRGRMRLRGVWRRMVLVLMRLMRLMGLVGQMGLRLRRGMVLLVDLLLICLSWGHAGTDESLELRVGRLFRVGYDRSLDLPRASDRTCTTMLPMSMSGGGRCKVIRLLRRKRGEDGGLDVGR
jgi:hypothetical protein